MPSNDRKSEQKIILNVNLFLRIRSWLCSKLAVKRISDQISHKQTFLDGGASDYHSLLNRAIQLRKNQRVVGLFVLDDALEKVKKIKMQSKWTITTE